MSTNRGEEAIPAVEIAYLGKERVKRLLGATGKGVLKKVLSLIMQSATEGNWPLKGVEIQYAEDPEVEEWEYVRVLLVFASSFEEADKRLKELYPPLARLGSKLTKAEQEILREFVSFNVRTLSGVSSS